MPLEQPLLALVLTLLANVLNHYPNSSSLVAVGNYTRLLRQYAQQHYNKHYGNVLDIEENLRPGHRRANCRPRPLAPLLPLRLRRPHLVRLRRPVDAARAEVAFFANEERGFDVPASYKLQILSGEWTDVPGATYDKPLANAITNVK
ncbi:hypothetical protein CSHISOI_10809 [Colletotrichum shisoi]|uniref:Uncharacterized protein n=1 Tax=Colletotrichum shisoi TaxID=2078593 RepID=A0A5Q4BCU9_9PEZI|nr:hypothetical protein CSHISOI_10809 [Colletotrichum shisoi]